MRQKQHLTMLDKQTGCRNFRKHWTIARETMMYKCSYIKCEKLQQCLMIRKNEKLLYDDKASELSLKKKEYTKVKINRQLLALTRHSSATSDELNLKWLFKKQFQWYLVKTILMIFWNGYAFVTIKRIEMLLLQIILIYYIFKPIHNRTGPGRTNHGVNTTTHIQWALENLASIYEFLNEGKNMIYHSTTAFSIPKKDHFKHYFQILLFEASDSLLIWAVSPAKPSIPGTLLS